MVLIACVWVAGSRKRENQLFMQESSHRLTCVVPDRKIGWHHITSVWRRISTLLSFRCQTLLWTWILFPILNCCKIFKIVVKFSNCCEISKLCFIRQFCQLFNSFIGSAPKNYIPNSTINKHRNCMLMLI